MIIRCSHTLISMFIIYSRYISYINVNIASSVQCSISWYIVSVSVQLQHGCRITTVVVAGTDAVLATVAVSSTVAVSGTVAVSVQLQ